MKRLLISMAAGLLVLALAAAAYLYSRHEQAKTFAWGLTFSHRHAEYLGFDWKTLYLDMLNDLQPDRLRLMAYWEDIEPVRGSYDFSIPAQMLSEAERRGIEVILVLGRKQPRWPECHQPAWYSGLPPAERDRAQLEMVDNAVRYFRQFNAVKVWQVENEPLFSFGDNCPQTDRQLVLQEMETVRRLDSRPILLTDSGELGRWLPTARLEPDIFGSTMYRVVHNPRLGYFKYPLGPWFFKIKSGLIREFAGIDRIMGVELQAEPWFADGGVHKTDLQTQYALMNPVIFREYADYARRVGFSENYLWGVEWWYWLAKIHGDWGMWNEAKLLLAEEPG